mgnify:CR=1 FL=1
MEGRKIEKMEQPSLVNIRRIARNDKLFEEKLIQVAKRELPVEISVFEQNIMEQEYRKAADYVHKIKHKIMLLDLESDFNLAEEFERGLLFGKTTLLVSFREVLTKMTVFLKNV